MDIEGDEWQIFSATPKNDLRKFSQIICKFHAFHAVDNDDWYKRALTVLEKLHQVFAVVHIHANNYAPLNVIGNLPFPEVLEVTYAARLRYRFEPTDEIFPTSLDAPNNPNLPDFFLELIREVWIHDEWFAARRLSIMRIMARRTNAATVVV